MFEGPQTAQCLVPFSYEMAQMAFYLLRRTCLTPLSVLSTAKFSMVVP